MTPEQLVDLVDFRYITDALTRDEALALLRDAAPGRAERIATLRAGGYPAYTTSPGWLGYSDEKLVRLARQAVADGFRAIKIKVGLNLDDDISAQGAEFLRQAAKHLQGEGFELGQGRRQPRAPRRKGL